MNSPTRNSEKIPTSPKTSQGGFSLVEMIVAVGLFAVVMVICVSTLFALVNANRKAQALQSVMNNLNIALDNMARTIRMGRSYHCAVHDGTDAPVDCINGNAEIAFQPYGVATGNLAQYGVFKYDSVSKAIFRSLNNGSTWQQMTAPEITVDSMNFYVVGSTPGDAVQPRVIIVVKGTAGATSVKTRSTFHIQVGATQRVIDL